MAEHDPHEKNAPSDEDQDDQQRERRDPHARPGKKDLPFGDDPQGKQGDDPASGGS